MNNTFLILRLSSIRSRDDDAGRGKVTVPDGTYSEESGQQEVQLGHIHVIPERVPVPVSVMDTTPAIYECRISNQVSTAVG